MSKFSNEPIFKYFEEISQIPRGSGNEKGISDYLVNFAKSRNLEVIQDKANNVIIKKSGTLGYENAPTVILQGHMDMVCDKNKVTEHDFEKDPIKLRVEGDMLYATDTTLGADNGIAISYALELLASDKTAHPPIEVLITTQEETGMDGALAIEPGNLKGKLLINMDSEEEGKLLVSCAGGTMVKQILPIKCESAKENMIPYLISITGLKGGHSGMEINMGRGNSNKLIGRVLNGLSEEIEYYIEGINGGFKPNAIPREVDVVIIMSTKDEANLMSSIEKWNKIFKNELRVSDPGVTVNAEKLNKTVRKVFSKETNKKIISLLITIPSGVHTMSMDIKGLVESSTNLGVITTTDTEIIFESAVRSCVKSLKQEILSQCKMSAQLTGAEYIAYSDYPEWAYNPDSRLRKVFETVYEKKYGKKPEVAAIHAGLECGLFKEKMPDIDMISLGPNLYDVHTPDEHVSISSTKSVWEYLIDVLKEIK